MTRSRAGTGWDAPAGCRDSSSGAERERGWGVPHERPGEPSASLAIAVPDELVERIAERAADLVLARLSRADVRSPYLSVAEAAEYLRAKPQRVYDLLSSGRLTRVKEGSRVLIKRAELDAYLARSGLSRVAPMLPRRPQTRSTKGFTA